MFPTTSGQTGKVKVGPITGGVAALLRDKLSFPLAHKLKDNYCRQLGSYAVFGPGGPYMVPYPYYNSFYGYYGAVYPVVYAPDYLKKEKKVRIETNFYVVSSQEGELVWTGITDTFNPSKPHKAINELVKLVVKQMQSEDVL